MATLRLKKPMVCAWAMITQTDSDIHLEAIPDDPRSLIGGPALGSLRTKYKGICDKMEEVFFEIENNISLKELTWPTFLQFKEESRIKINSSASLKCVEEFLPEEPKKVELKVHSDNDIMKPEGREVNLFGQRVIINTVKTEPQIDVMPDYSNNLDISEITKIIRKTLGITSAIYKQIKSKEVSPGITEITFYNGQFGMLPSNENSQKLLDAALPKYLIDVIGISISSRGIQSYTLQIHTI